MSQQNISKNKVPWLVWVMAVPVLAALQFVVRGLRNGWSDAHTFALIFLVFAAVGGVAMMTYVSRRIAARAFVVKATGNIVDPILYLRSFKDDSVFRVPHAAPRWLRAAQPSLQLEELLVQILSSHGTVLAIGRPSEVLPPLGAARVYLPDASWKGQVRSLLERSKIVIMLLSGSSGFLREFRTAYQMHLLQRVILIVPPSNTDDLQQRWRLLVEGMAGEALPLPASLPSGTIAIAFDDANRVRLSILEECDTTQPLNYLLGFKASVAHLIPIFLRRAESGISDAQLETTFGLPTHEDWRRESKHGFLPPGFNFEPPSTSFEPPRGWSGD